MRVFYHKILRLYSNNITRKSLERVWKMSTQGVILKQLSSTQKKNIQSYWYEMTGKKVSCKWHQLLYTLTGTYTETYMPFEIYYDMINTLSPWKSRISFDDKNLYRYLFKDFRIPDRVLECYNNVYYSGVNGGGILK